MQHLHFIRITHSNSRASTGSDALHGRMLLPRGYPYSDADAVSSVVGEVVVDPLWKHLSGGIGQRRDATRASAQRPEWPGRHHPPPGLWTIALQAAAPSPRFCQAIWKPRGV